MHKPIVAAGAVVEAGSGVWLHAGGSYIAPASSAEKLTEEYFKEVRERPGVLEIKRKKGVFVIPMNRGPKQTPLDILHRALCPVIEKEDAAIPSSSSGSAGPEAVAPTAR